MRSFQIHLEISVNNMIAYFLSKMVLFVCVSVYRLILKHDGIYDIRLLVCSETFGRLRTLADRCVDVVSIGNRYFLFGEIQ